MNSSRMNNSTLSINSKHFSNRIDTDIIQLTKTLMVEFQVSIEEARVIARKMVQRKLNSILTKEEFQGIEDLIEITKESIRGQITDIDGTEYAKTVYELLKTMELL